MIDQPLAERRTIVRALAFAAAVVAAASAAAEPHSARELFRPPLYRWYALSPDGRYMLETALTDKDDADRLERVRTKDDLLKLGQPDQRVLLTDLKTMRFIDITPSNKDLWVSGVRWLDDHDFVWLAQDRRRGESTLEVREVVVDAKDDVGIGAVRVLGKDARVLAAVVGAPWQLVVVHFGDDGEEVYRIDARRPLFVQLVAANRLGGPFRGVTDWVIDAAGAVRAVGLLRRGEELRVLVRDPAGWRRAATFPITDLDTTALVGRDDASGKLLVVTDHGTDKSVLRELDPASGALGRIVFGDARNDVSAAFADPRDGRIIGVLLNDDETRIQFIDPAVARLQAEADRLLPRSNPRVINVSADHQHAIAFTGQSDQPGRYYYVSTAPASPARGKALLIESAAPWLDGKRFSRSEPIEVKARDGLTIYGQFTRPLAGAAPAGATRPPLVLMPHGGPFGVRDTLRYDPNVQFLASRGYAVLQVDFRGSGGYGREYKVAGFKRWGAEMQDDLIDALDSVIARGWADPARVCVFGGSYGGYAAMMSVILTPERFRCAVTYAGVSDLTLLIRSAELRDLPFANEARFEYLREALGDPEKERAVLQSRSPAYLAKGITRPVFIAHGDADARVEPEHAWRLRATIEAGGGKVEWLMAKGEGHGFRKAENIDAFYDQLAAFLERNLGAPPAATAPAKP